MEEFDLTDVPSNVIEPEPPGTCPIIVSSRYLGPVSPSDAAEIAARVNERKLRHCFPDRLEGGFEGEADIFRGVHLKGSRRRQKKGNLRVR